MSAFLGKIHYWLYSKILLHERLIDSVVASAKEKGYDSDEGLLKESYARFGSPVTGALDVSIDLSNIHGWLQERIFSVEKRLAYVITELLKQEILSTEEIARIFKHNGAEAAKALEIAEDKPQNIYTLVFDHMLEGMPCDGVNEMVENNDDLVSWKTRRCLHKDHWDEAGGDIRNFYYFRDNWINGFLEEMGTGFTYSSNEDGIKSIRRG